MASSAHSREPRGRYGSKGARGVLRLVLFPILTCAALSLGSGHASAATVTFSFTGGEQAFKVPKRVTSLSVLAVGARGGEGATDDPTLRRGGLAGFGDRLTAILRVRPGQTLFVNVGGNGTNGVKGVGGSGVGGFNGGGSSVNGMQLQPGGGGGGATDLRTCSRSATKCNSLASRLLVAGGGGGGGAQGRQAQPTGGGGGSAGNAGQTGVQVGCPGGNLPGSGGGAGTASGFGAGGAAGGAGTQAAPGGAGALGQGGAAGASISTYQPGGGGGGGYFGGGAGGGGNGCSGGGGGGGSSFLGAARNGALSTDATATPLLTLTYFAKRCKKGKGKKGAAGAAKKRKGCKTKKK